MKNPKKLLDFYKNPRLNGIFYEMFQDSELSSLLQKLGIKTADEAHMMDFEYLYNHSGLKTLSSMLERMITGYVMDNEQNLVDDSKGKSATWDYIITQVDQDIITFVIKTKFVTKWNELADTLFLEYDVLSPYQMEINDNTEDTLQSTGIDTSSMSDSASGEISQTNNGSDDSSRYGFNSTEAVPTDKNERQSTNTGTNSSESSQERSSENNYNRTGNISRVLTRKGNIGNHSAADLIEQQREMLMYQIFDTLYRDLDSVLTRSKYF